MQLTPKVIEHVVEATNLHAYASGARSRQYADFIPFDAPELYLGKYCTHLMSGLGSGGQHSSDVDDNGGCMISHAAGGDRHISMKFPPKEFIGKQSKKDTTGTGWME